jgi:hypothetical protein
MTCTDEAYYHIESVIHTCIEIAGFPDLDVSTCLVCAKALNNLSNHSQHRARMITEGAVSALVTLLQGNTPELQGIVGGVLLNLSTCKGELRSTMIREKAPAALVTLSRLGSEETRQRCVVALSNLTMDAHNGGRIAEQVLPAIIGLSTSEDGSTQRRCAAALRSLSSQGKSLSMIIENGACKVLLSLLKADSEAASYVGEPSHTKRDCIVSLCNILGAPNQSVVQQAISEHAVEALIDGLIPTFAFNESERARGIWRVASSTMFLLATLAETRESVSSRRCIMTFCSLSNTDEKVARLSSTSALCLLAGLESVRTMLLEKPTEIVPILVAHLADEDDRIRRNMVVTLSYLACTMTSRRLIAQQGIEPLMGLASSPSWETQAWCGALICALSFCDDTRENMIAQGVCKALVALSRGGDESTATRCAVTFCNLSAQAPAAEGGAAGGEAVKDLRHVLVEEGAVSALLALSSSHNEDTRQNCAKALCNLGCSVGSESLIVDEGAVSEIMILAMVRSESEATKLVCATALVNLICDNTRKKMVEEGLIWAVTALSKLESEEAMRVCGTALGNLACDPFSRKKMIEERGAIHALIGLFSSKVPYTREMCWTTLWNICTENCQIRMLEEGIISALETIVVGADDHVARNCAALLSYLALDDRIRLKIVRATEAVKILIELSNSTNQDTVQRCAEFLCVLAKSPHTCGIIVAKGAMTALHNLSKSDTFEVRMYCVRTLYFLSLLNENLGPVVEQGAVEIVNRLADDASGLNNLEPLELAVATLRSLSWHRPSQAMLAAQGATRVLCRFLAKAVEHDLCSTVLEYDCSEALCQLSLNKSHATAMLKEGALSTILGLASDEGVLPRPGEGAGAEGKWEGEGGEEKMGAGPSVGVITGTKANCARALRQFAMDEAGHADLLAQGVVPTLVALASIRNDGIRLNCAATLCSLSKCVDSRATLMKEGALRVITDLGRSENALTRASCAEAVANLSTHIENVEAGAVSAVIGLCLPGSVSPSAGGGGGGVPAGGSGGGEDGKEGKEGDEGKDGESDEGKDGGGVGAARGQEGKSRARTPGTDASPNSTWQESIQQFSTLTDSGSTMPEPLPLPVADAKPEPPHWDKVMGGMAELEPGPPKPPAQSGLAVIDRSRNAAQESDETDSGEKHVAYPKVELPQHRLWMSPTAVEVSVNEAQAAAEGDHAEMLAAQEASPLSSPMNSPLGPVGGVGSSGASGRGGALLGIESKMSMAHREIHATSVDVDRHIMGKESAGGLASTKLVDEEKNSVRLAPLDGKVENKVDAGGGNTAGFTAAAAKHGLFK